MNRSIESELITDVADSEFRWAADFPTVTEADWLGGVRTAVMRGRPDATDDEFAAAFARQLVTNTADGYRLDPLYTSTDAASELPISVRGRGPVPWEIRQRVWADGVDSSAVDELESGATGIVVDLGAGLAPADVAPTLQRVLTGVLAELAPVSLAATDDDGTVAAGALLDYWQAAGVATPHGSLGVDPIGAWLRTGGAAPLDYRGAAKVLQRGRDAANVAVMAADATVLHDAGATPAQELAWGIAIAVHHCRALDAFVDDGAAATSIEFRWSADDDQFTTIAKLRAARLIWARVAEVSGFDGSRARHHAEGSRAMMSGYDVWVNALRSTVACFAAAVGGADSITIWPHDAVTVRGGSALGRRISRNTQSIIQLESHMARVADPAGGSWYVERLTTHLAEAAWATLTDIDGHGGLARAVESGMLHDALARSVDERDRAVARRTRPLTGVSEFPNPGETGTGGSGFADEPERNRAAFAPLRLQRVGAAFESLRRRSDRASNARPTVWLATLGDAASHAARVGFAQNLLGTVGVATVVADITSAPPGTTVAVLCGSDADYANDGAAAVAAIRAGGATHVVLAGKAELAGIDGHLFAGCDAIAVGTHLLDLLGVPQ